MSAEEQEPLLLNGRPHTSDDLPSSTPMQALDSTSSSTGNSSAVPSAPSARAPAPVVTVTHHRPTATSAVTSGPTTPTSGTTDWGDSPAGVPYQHEPPFRWNTEGVMLLRNSDLNEDGEALYRFLLSQADNPPNFLIHVRGFRRGPLGPNPPPSGATLQGANDPQGPNSPPGPFGSHAAEFDFKIDLTQHLLQAVKWTVSDDEPTYRGKIVPEKEVQNGMWLEPTITTEEENAAADQWKEARTRCGHPPWAPKDIQDNANLSQPQPALGGSVYRSSKTLHDWTGEYCASNKLLKEFIFDKVVYGWNLEAIEKSIERLVRSTYFEGQLSIEFIVTNNEVKVRPDNDFTRILGFVEKYVLLKVLLILTLIYPLLWVWQRYWPLGGGKWKVSGAAYPLKQWVHMEDSVGGETVVQYLMRKGEIQVAPSPPPYVIDQKRPISPAQPHTQVPHPLYSSPPTYSASPSDPASMIPLVGNNVLSRFKQTPRGISRLVGMREGEWFKQWENTMLRAVMSKLNQQTPLSSPSQVVAESSGAALDGYD